MKHLHMTLAVLSIALFSVRFFLTLANSAKLQQKWLKITPHVIDTLLLAVGIGMAVKLALNPFEQLWLGEKLIAIVAYIFTGFYALKFARNRTMQIFGYVGAVGWFMLVARIAMTKQTFIF